MQLSSTPSNLSPWDKTRYRVFAENDFDPEQLAALKALDKVDDVFV
jgi:hypothetical protein